MSRRERAVSGAAVRHRPGQSEKEIPARGLVAAPSGRAAEALTQLKAAEALARLDAAEAWATPESTEEDAEAVRRKVGRIVEDCATELAHEMLAEGVRPGVRWGGIAESRETTSAIGRLRPKMTHHGIIFLFQLGVKT